MKLPNIMPIPEDKSSYRKGEFKGIGTVLIVLAVIVIVFLVLNKIFRFGSGILEGVGLKDSAEENRNEVIIKNNTSIQTSKGINSFWSPKYYQSLNVPQGTTILNAAGIDKVATLFWDSVGYLWDSPAKGLAAVKMCGSGYQLSQVVNGFAQKYGIDLLGWMNNKYDTADQKQYLVEILKYANQLKQF